MAEKKGNNMTRQRKTSPAAGRASSKVLRNPKSSKNAKIAAGSALSQRAPKRKKPSRSTRTK
jgi:hypothetical protein